MASSGFVQSCNIDSISILIPCRNEEATVAKVIKLFSQEVPTATIWVIDNGSTDETAKRAEDAGAQVISVAAPGKGIAVRRAIELIDSAIYVMVDGDGTYDASSLKQALVEFRSQDLDFSTGTRTWSDKSPPRTMAQRIGGFLVRVMFLVLYGLAVKDPLSGLRILSRRFVKSVQFLSVGFELEVEMTSLAILADVKRSEFPVVYYERASEASPSKIHVFRDGVQILSTTLSIFMRNRLPHLVSVTAVIFSVPCLFVGIKFGRWLDASLLICVSLAALIIGFAFVHNALSRRTRAHRVETHKVIGK